MTKKAKRTRQEIKLLSDIIEAHGGVMAVAKKLKTSKQLVSFWKTKGFVPLSRVMDVALILKVPPISLNFKDINRILGGDKSWETVIKDGYLALRLL